MSLMPISILTQTSTSMTISMKPANIEIDNGIDLDINNNIDEEININIEKDMQINVDIKSTSTPTPTFA